MRTLQEKAVRAIRIIERARLSHVKWKEYYEKWPEVAQKHAELFGDDGAFHTKAVLRYDFVLKVLAEVAGPEGQQRITNEVKK